MDTKIFFIRLNKIPDVLLNEIFQYIPKKEKLFLNKSYYLNGHHDIFLYIKKRGIENFIRTMVRKDNDFIIYNLLIENHLKWLQMTRYYYNKCIYQNYVYFLHSYSLDNESTKCRNVIQEFLERLNKNKLGFNENQHKKKPYKYIEWKH